MGNNRKNAERVRLAELKTFPNLLKLFLIFNAKNFARFSKTFFTSFYKLQTNAIGLYLIGLNLVYSKLYSCANTTLAPAGNEELRIISENVSSFI